MKPKNWILTKNLTDSEYQAIRVGCPTYKIKAETEKAYKFEIQTNFGNIYTWCPKSQVEEDGFEIEEEQLTEEEELKKFEAIDAKLARGLEYNMKLREVLNANGIKTSMKRRISNATLIEKIKVAGLEVPARA